MFRRIISFLLTISLIVSTPLAAYAEGSAGGIPVTPVNSGGGSNPTIPDSWGIKVSVSSIQPIIDAGIAPINGTSDSSAARTQYDAIVDINRTRMWDPGCWGLNFIYNPRTPARVMSDPLNGKTDPGVITSGIQNAALGADAVAQKNQLAWMIYLTGNPTSRPGETDYTTGASSTGGYSYSSEIYDLLVGSGASTAISTLGSAQWLESVKQLYLANGGSSDFDGILRSITPVRDGNAGKNWRYFTWASFDPNDEDVWGGNTALHIYWSNVGILSSACYVAWAAQKIGDTNTYNETVAKIANWAASGYDSTAGLTIVLEPVSGIFQSGSPAYVNGPASLQAAHANFSAVQMYALWPQRAEDGNYISVLNQFATGKSQTDATRNCISRQYYSAYWRDGAVRVKDYYRRDYGSVVTAIDGTSLWGWGVNFPLYTDGPSFPNTNPDPKNPGNTMGSFTWKLTPNGTHDKTPDTEVHETSTIYDLNISQDGYNDNNYTSNWVPTVTMDGVDCNKIRVRIYHVSENLTEEQEATKYARDAVKQRGADVTTPINKVTIGSGYITGFPAGSGLAELKNNEWSTNLTDTQFLTIMKLATGLSYNETIAGKLVNGTTPEGVRVTYAVYVDYDIGCKSPTNPPQLSNDQAEFVEYRSIPGTYTYISDSPEGYAEIKCGYFDRDKGYFEPYETMAGSPTTENLYFVSGGQDFVAQIKYEFVENDKDAIRNFDQNYSTTQCEGYWTPVTKTFNNASTAEVQAWLNTWTGSPHTSGEFITAKKCTQCGTVHQNGTGSESIQSTSITNSESGDLVSIGGYYTEVDLHATHWDWTGCPYESHEEGDPPHTVVDCPGHSAKSDSTSGCCSHDSAVRATRWSGTVKSYHVDYNENSAHQNNTAHIAFQQKYHDVQYAKIKDVHVWRLEQSRVEGIRQLTFAQDDYIVGNADSYADVVFNVAEADTAKEGRMYYILHPADGDDFKFTATLPTRGCCHCFVHNAAEDLIKTNEGMVANDAKAATQLEEGWVVSDYLVLKGTRATASLLYAQYQSRNKDANKYPILNIRVSGTDQTSRQDNTYEYIGPDNQWHKIGYSDRDKRFETQTIDYNATIASGGTANANDGNEEKICRNPETFKGGNVDSDDISWGGYNGQYTQTSKKEYAASELEDVGKYQGIRRVNNWKGDTGKKIFMTGYQHNQQGEVAESGWSTSAPVQHWNEPDKPFILVYNDIDVHDVKVHNGEKEFDNSTIFYNNIISYSSVGGTDSGVPLWSEETDKVYNRRGFHVDTNYCDSYSGINKIVIHNPVSAQYAKLIPLPEDLDQRVDTDSIIDSLNQDTGKCPGKANACAYAELNCKYNGTWYHTEDCYVEVRGTGLATVPVKGSITTTLKPVQHGSKNLGSKQFGYTGARQTFTAPVAGRYHFDVYGAQGGTTTKGGSGGKGGYTYGDIYLNAGQVVYIYVGGMGTIGYNGGGYNGGGGGSAAGGGGGGMSSVSLSNSSAAAPSNYRGTSANTKRYTYNYETVWKATDGNYYGVVVDPGNNTDFTLQEGHTYVIGYPSRGYYNELWGYLYDTTTGYCLSNKKYASPNSSFPKYTLDLYASRINGAGASGITRTVIWNSNAGYKLIAGGGGGAGPADGGVGGGATGGEGTKRFGTAGKGGTQTAGGAAGTKNANAGLAGIGGSGLTTASKTGGGGGGGGWFGGGAGGNDYSRYNDVDDSGGGGGSGLTYTSEKAANGEALVTKAGMQSGVRTGNGLVKVTWSIDTTYTTYEPVITGSLEYDKSAAAVIPSSYKPYVYTAPMDGYYSIHLYGSAGGGATPDGKTDSARGKGGYAAGQLLLTKGQKILVTCGGMGSNAATVASDDVVYAWTHVSGCAGEVNPAVVWSKTKPAATCTAHDWIIVGQKGVGNSSGGYNGGGNGGLTSGGSFGGGGATDIALNYVYKNANTMSTNAANGAYTSGGALVLPKGAYYFGPRMSVVKGDIYRVDFYGSNLDKASFDSLGYRKSDSARVDGDATLLHAYITSSHAQLFYRVDIDVLANHQEFRVLNKDSNTEIRVNEVFVVNMKDRLMTAGAGGGSDNAAGTGSVYGGADDGRGGDGGGVNGGAGYTDGKLGTNGASATSGYLPGIGQDATSTSDQGAGGAGWYGGYRGPVGNSGGGGGSSNKGDLRNAITQAGQNSGSGYAVFVLPGKGNTDNGLALSCGEPHHAPNSNWHLYVAGWKHEGGFTCTGVGCTWCAKGTKLYSPTGLALTPGNLTNLYIIQHDGQVHLTHGTSQSAGDPCDTCGGAPDGVDKYSTDGTTWKDCVWPATSYDAACFNTQGAKNPEYHYGFGDSVCYDPCNNDENHKKKNGGDSQDPVKNQAGQFVVLDYDFEAYFPNRGDFYGNGALGIKNTQKPEGWGYYGGTDGKDPMDTTIWLKEKYIIFPFDVTYKGTTYLAGEKVMLGTYDENTYTWHDDEPDTYRYKFHCLLDNLEAAATKIDFVAIAKNTPNEGDTIENTVEDHNYTRYGNIKRAYHDALKSFYIDVIGRIGVLSILDTGDFRFSNYYKETLPEWKVDQVVHEVDLSKQNYVSVDLKTIFNDPVSEATKGQNTWGLTDWMQPISKLRPFPLTPGENNVKALKNQAHRIGYSDYMSLVTVGNYYGENAWNGNNEYKVQIQPYYYYYNLNTKEWVPVDVYIRQDGDAYKLINKYGSTESTAEYNFYYDLNWQTENERRMYTDEEEAASQAVSQAYQMIANGAEDGVDGTFNVSNIQLPHGIKYLHGTANMLFLRDRNRTFIGTRYRYGENTEEDNRIPNVKFNRQAQRWHFTLGLPSTAAFVRKGEECTPENIAKYDMENGVIVCALDILSEGTVWTLHYDGTPVGERSFYLFDNDTTKISWEDAGEDGPEEKIVVVVYTDSKTSRNDLTTEGTH